MKKILIFLCLLYLCSCAIGGYDATPAGWVSNYSNASNTSNKTTAREPDEILEGGDADCEAYSITGPKTKKDCQQYTLKDPDYKCWFVSFSVGTTYNNAICLRVAYTASSIGDVKYAFRHAKNVTILCNEKFIVFHQMFILFMVFVSLF